MKDEIKLAAKILLIFAILWTLILASLFGQAKDTIPSVMGVFYYKTGVVVYRLNNQRSIIATMNQRFTRPKLDSVWLCKRGGNVLKAKPFKIYRFVKN